MLCGGPVGLASTTATSLVGLGTEHLTRIAATDKETAPAAGTVGMASGRAGAIAVSGFTREQIEGRRDAETKTIDRGSC